MLSVGNDIGPPLAAMTTLIAAIAVRDATTICPLASFAVRDTFSP